MPGVVSLSLIATYKGGYTGTAVSTFLVLFLVSSTPAMILVEIMLEVVL